MLVLAASTDQPENVFEVVTRVFSRLDALTHPKPLLEALQMLPIVWGVVFLVAGLVCLLEGYKFYKVVTVCLALTIGAFAGYRLGQEIKAEYIVAASLSLLLAVVCFPLMKYAVASMGGIVGAFLGANAWSAVATLMSRPEASQHCWIGALVGLIVCGMLAFILWKLSIVLFTSVSGSTLAAIGAAGLMLQFPAVREMIRSNLDSKAHVVIPPLLVAVPALIGLIHQESQGGGSAEPA
jgi:hypothetical protein